MKQVFIVLLFALLLLIPAVVLPQVKVGSGVDFCSSKEAATAEAFKPGKTGLKQAYDVHYLRFSLAVDPAVEFLSGSVLTRFEVTGDLSSGLPMELSTAYVIDSVLYNGQRIAFAHTGAYSLLLNIPGNPPVGSVGEVEVFYRGVPPSGTGFGSVGWKDHNGVPSMWTLSEPYGCRDWWPGKNDLTDKADSIDVIVRTPSAYRTASNGLLLSNEVNDGLRTCHWKHRYPIASYLIAVAVTNYAVYSDFAHPGGVEVEIQNYVYPEDSAALVPKTAQTAMVMELYGNLFSQYPFAGEKYGHAQFGWGGGMEHQTMSFMGRFDYEIIAHELAHQWFGDKITLNSWHDIWLNEAFATYLSALTYEHFFNGYYWSIWKTQSIGYVTSEPDGSVYVADTANVERLFSSRLTYYKAALLLHMLRWVTGDSAFFSACRDYLNDPKLMYGFAGTADLKAHLEASSGRDLTEFFNDWFYGQGYPSYNLRCIRLASSDYEVQLSQTQSDPSVSFFEMPVPVRFYGEGRDTTLVFNHTSDGQVFYIYPDFAIDSIALDPDLWLVSANNHLSLIGKPGSVSLYPNPSTGQIRLAMPGLDDGSLRVYDAYGREVKLNCTAEGAGLTLDAGGLASGLYMIRFNDVSGSSHIAKFVRK